MKYLNLPTDNGALKSYGRALAYDDLYALEQLALLPQTIIRGIGDCIVDACRIEPTDTNYLPSGTVMLNNRFYEFQGGQLNGQRYLIPGTPSYDADRPAPTAPGGSRTVAGPRNEYAVLTNSVPSGSPWIDISNPLTTIRLEHRWQDRMTPRGTIQWLAQVEAADYDADGRGRGKALGWALCNGNANTGAVDLRGRFPLGHNPWGAQTSAFSGSNLGDLGGEEKHQLTVGELPSHDHVPSGTPARFLRMGPYANIVADTNYSMSQPHLNSGVQPASVGNNEAHQNMPPYFVLAARQWIGL